MLAMDKDLDAIGIRGRTTLASAGTCCDPAPLTSRWHQTRHLDASPRTCSLGERRDEALM